MLYIHISWYRFFKHSSWFRCRTYGKKSVSRDGRKYSEEKEARASSYKRGHRDRRTGWKWAFTEHLLCARHFIDVIPFTLHCASFYIWDAKAREGGVTCSQSQSLIWELELGFNPGFPGFTAPFLSSKSYLKWLWRKETGWGKSSENYSREYKGRAWIWVPSEGALGCTVDWVLSWASPCE